jgi:hypothetical protein
MAYHGSTPERVLSAPKLNPVRVSAPVQGDVRPRKVRRAEARAAKAADPRRAARILRRGGVRV